MGLLGQLTGLGIAGAAIRATIPAFSGEDPLGDAPGPENWHHEGLTRQAARAAGWSEEAENALAFHADYLDSYLYNPLWWFDVANGGGPGRLVAVMSSQSELVKLHFDDLVHPESVRGSWRRYLSGTVAGLISLGYVESGTLERRTAMAQNLVGASLHAVQDFYSHSNWIDDDDLRSRTWFEVDLERRACLSLWTGTYEVPDHLGIKPHGAYLFACTIINNLGSAGRGLMNMVCHAASPFSNSSLCRWFRQCESANPPEPPEIKIPGIGRIDPPKGIVWVEPGINVDNRWIADVGVSVRGLSISGGEAFEAAYELAFRSSCQWLHILDHVMEGVDLTEFWHAVKTQGVAREQYKTPRTPWEDFSQIPYRFISAGPYPPPQGHVDTDDWYLRLLIRTATDLLSGTDADIVPFVNGRRFPVLDHGVQPAPGPGGRPPSRSLEQTLMGRNDFEAGDVAAYMIGPIDEPPHTVVLLNDARDAGETIRAAADALWRELGVAFDALVDSFKGLWGYHADFVDEAHEVIGAATLEALGPGGRHWFFLDCDGKSEGFYRISGYVEGTSETGRFPNSVPWRRYRVRFEDLRCIKESEWDRFTDSDEPFVLGLVIPHGGTQPMISWLTDPYGGVDTGDTVTIGHSVPIEVPQRYGFISVACAVYESDDETPNDRDRLLAEFARNVGTDIVAAQDNFIEVLGESIASGWRLDSVEAVAFRRSPTVEVRSYEPRTFNRWVDGGDQVEWTLSEHSTWRVAVPDTINCECEVCTAEVVLPLPEVDIPRLDFRPKPGGRRKRPERDHGQKEVPVDLAEFDPRCRRWARVEDPLGQVDDAPAAPRPKDGCP